MKLPQHYKRWPALRPDENCANVLQRPWRLELCPNRAVEMGCLVNDSGELWMWFPVCADCLVKHGKEIVTKAQWAKANGDPS